MTDRPTISRERAEGIARLVCDENLAVVPSWRLDPENPKSYKAGPEKWQETQPWSEGFDKLVYEITATYGKHNLLAVTLGSRVITIDCDGPTGLELFRSLDAPRTLCVKSGRSDGGYHYIYRPPAEGLDYTFFELAGDGTPEVNAVRNKLHVLAGIHPSGREYSVAGEENGNTPIATLPQGIYDRLLSMSKARAKKTREGITETEKIGPSGRHQHLVSRSGQLWNLGLRDNTLREALLAVYRNECEHDPEKDAGIEEEIAGIATYAHETYEEREAEQPPINIEPAAEPALEWDGNLLTLLADTAKFIRTYIVLGQDETRAVALWIGHTYIIDFVDFTAYLEVNSVVRSCGKSHLQEVMAAVCHNPELASNITTAGLYQTIEAERPTLFLDEVDAIFGGKVKSEASETLRGILNAGFERGRKVRRGNNERAQGEDKPRALTYDVFGPKCFASIGELPDTIASRSIRIRMHRKRADEKIKRLRKRRLKGEARTLRQRWQAWARTIESEEAFYVADHLIPIELDGRAADIWEPLLAIADMAGGSWPTETRAGAIRLSSSRDVEDETAGIHLLSDIHEAFADDEKLSTKELLSRLTTKEDSRWVEWSKGNPLTSRGLSRLLRPFGVKPGQLWIDGENHRGYDRSQFRDPWDRYLSRYTARTPMDTGKEAISHPLGLADGEEGSNPHEQTELATLADKNGDTPPEEKLDLGTASWSELERLLTRDEP
jgi:hypothetical protein